MPEKDYKWLEIGGVAPSMHNVAMLDFEAGAGEMI